MNPVFEALQEKDIPALRSFMEGLWDYCPERIKAFLSEKQNIALAATLDGNIIGLIYGYALTRFDGKAAQFFIYSVDIAPAYQGKGYGGDFIKYAAEWARTQGFGESFVLTDKANAPACRIYEKAGMTHSATDCERMYVIEYSQSQFTP
ncbi:MAG: GNAT family N-acetyltransferase [Clostridiales bacterium]|nr:GNAT family N-acetyltransferase [Clostridiales bacterium]